MKSIASVSILAAALALGCVGCNGSHEAGGDNGRRISLLEEENHRQSQTIEQHRRQSQDLNERIARLEAEKKQTEQAANDSVTFLMHLMADKDAELAKCLEQLEERQR